MEKRKQVVRQITSSYHEKKLFVEYHGIINDTIGTGATLTLLNVLEQLYFTDAGILKESSQQERHARYSNLKQLIKEQKNDLTIRSNTHP